MLTYHVIVENFESSRSLSAVVTVVGGDIVVVIGGGARPHVGSTVIAQPCGAGRSPSCSVLTIPPHKEETIARSVAEHLCRAFDRVVVVTAGVHEPDLDRKGIEQYLELASRLKEKLVEELSSI
jgi:hypothetical protein